MAAAADNYCLLGCNAVYPGRSLPTFWRSCLHLLGGWRQHVPRTRRQQSVPRSHVLKDIIRQFAVDFALNVKMHKPEIGSEEKNLDSYRETNTKLLVHSRIIIIDVMAVKCVLVRLRSSGA
jgi:hypothetical protein